jgi:hypothetical protein
VDIANGAPTGADATDQIVISWVDGEQGLNHERVMFSTSDDGGVHRGVDRDARGSSRNNLAAEFLGDYVYAAATRRYGTAVRNDVRNADDCPAVDAYRQKLHDEAVATGTQTAEAEEPRGEQDPNAEPDADAAEAPAPQQGCAAAPRFGNSDIFGWTSAP